MVINTLELKNGIRLVHVNDSSKVAHCGILLNTGSRDEDVNEHGMAHFIEHLLFKGTKKRNSFEIINRIENEGGEINAYTSKENTCIYSAFLASDYELAIELMSDVVFNSTFPASEVKKEKEVVIDEINSYKDNPSEQILDDFEDLVFKGNSIGRNILGTKKSLMKQKTKNLLHFIKTKYNTNQIVISSIGNIDFAVLENIVEKYLGCIPTNQRNFERKIIKSYTSRDIKKNVKTYQSHCVLGGLAYPSLHAKRAGFVLLNHILGGSCLSSRLNIALREKKGIAYNIESIYNTYSDIGIFSIYFGTDKKNISQSIDIIHKEIKLLKQKKLTTSQLSIAKKQLIGQILIASENKENYMLSIGKSLLMQNKVITLEELIKKYEQLESSELLAIANEIYDITSFSNLIFY